jgi:iron complex transport system ATP-binding protein
MTALQLSGVTVTYDGSAVVAGIDLGVAAGEWVGVIGPNGAGKSTMLGAVAGAVPFTGSVTLGGLQPRNRRQVARTVAHVPQQPTIPAGMRVADYVLLGRTPHIGLLATESHHDLEVVAGTLRALHISALAQRSMDTLSGGEMQRAILARALVQEAGVLLLDEPTAALDIGHQVEVFRLVDRLRRERGLAVVSAVHDLTLAARFCDRIALMHEGRVVAEGAPLDVITEANMRRYFGAGVRVLDLPEIGLIVVPDDGSGDGHSEQPADAVTDSPADDADRQVLDA